MKANQLLMAGALALLAGSLDVAYASPGVEVMTQEGLAYVSGGLGEDERSELREVAKDYDLWLTFASKGSGAYLADVPVSIRSARGTPVLNVTSEGPWFFTKLPPGKYQVSATVDGKTVTKPVSVPAKGHAELYFYWVMEEDIQTE